MQATRVTLTVALLTVAIATPLGVAAAYAISQSKLKIMRAIHITLLLPLVVPIIITAVGIFFVYARIGLVATMTGLVLANVMLGLPYVDDFGRGRIAEFRCTQEMVARSLGMNRLRSFFAVTLPQIRASVIAGGDFRLHLGDRRDHRRPVHFRRPVSAADQADVHGAARRDRSDHCCDQHIDDRGLLHAGAGRELAARRKTPDVGENGAPY